LKAYCLFENNSVPLRSKSCFVLTVAMVFCGTHNFSSKLFRGLLAFFSRHCRSYRQARRATW